MPTDKKTQHVSTIKFEPAHISIPLTVDRDNKLFHATFAGKTYEHADGKMLEQIVLEEIRKSLQVAWQPVIMVVPVSNSTHFARSARSARSARDEEILGFDMECQWIAQFPDGTYKWTQWDAQGDREHYRLAWSHALEWDMQHLGPFRPPCVKHWYGTITTYYLPHTELLWERLQVIQGKIKELRSQLLTLLSTTEGLELLMAVPVQLALPSPSSRENTVDENAGQSEKGSTYK